MSEFGIDLEDVAMKTFVVPVSEVRKHNRLDAEYYLGAEHDLDLSRSKKTLRDALKRTARIYAKVARSKTRALFIKRRAI